MKVSNHIRVLAPLFALTPALAQAQVCSDPSNLRMAAQALKKYPAFVIYKGDHRFPEMKCTPIQSAETIELRQDPCWSDRKELILNGQQVRIEHVFIREGQSYFRNLAFYAGCGEELLAAEPLGLEIRDPDSGKVKILSEPPLF